MLPQGFPQPEQPHFRVRLSDPDLARQLSHRFGEEIPSHKQDAVFGFEIFEESVQRIPQPPVLVFFRRDGRAVGNTVGQLVDQLPGSPAFGAVFLPEPVNGDPSGDLLMNAPRKVGRAVGIAFQVPR